MIEHETQKTVRTIGSHDWAEASYRPRAAGIWQKFKAKFFNKHPREREYYIKRVFSEKYPELVFFRDDATQDPLLVNYSISADKKGYWVHLDVNERVNLKVIILHP